MPGSDEDAGTWPSGSILRRLLPTLLICGSARALSVGTEKNEREQ